MKGGESSVALVLVTTMERVDFRGWWSVRLLRRGWFELPHWKLEMGKVGLSLSIIYISWSFRPSVRLFVCSLTFYWKELRTCNMAQNFRLLPEQIIGYLIYLFLKNIFWTLF